MKLLPLVAALTLLATVAAAHPHVVSASPPVGGTVATSPTELRINFSETVFPKLSGATVMNYGGQAAPTGKASVNPADKKQLIVPISAALAPGHYMVMWKAVSTDTHHVSGQFDFWVK